MSLLSRGGNRIKSFRPPINFPQPNLIATTSQDDNGNVVIIYVEQEFPDHGVISDYELETLLAAGIRPSRISTSDGTRLSASGQMQQFETIADNLLKPKSQPTE